MNTTVVTSSNPYVKGLKPRTFLSGRKTMLTKGITEGSGGLKYNPEWNKKKVA